MEFYKHVQYCFCYYVIKSAGEAANEVLLSVVWNPLLVEINLSQIRTFDIKREKVRAVCPYLLLKFIFPHSIDMGQFSNCGTRTTCGTSKVVRWYAIKFTKILNLNKRYGHTAHTFSRLLSDILIRERFISIDHGAQVTLLRGNASLPQPLLWRNEASLLAQWRSMYFTLAL